MNLFDIAVARKLSGGSGGGGGGSSDFSTATVTVVNGIGRLVAEVFNIMSFDGYEGMVGQAEIASKATTTINAVLYKNTCEFYVDLSGNNISVTGNASYEGDGFVLITGDCTITTSYVGT